jgi:hypothetical protein
VNMAATGVLYEAAAAARRLERPGHGRWEAIAQEMFVPRRGDVVLNHDKFTPEEDGVTGATPETLAALFPVGYCLDPKAERATIDFYLGRVEPYLGHPMLSPLLGVYAAWIGDRARSAELFEKGYAEFINEPFTETDEFSRPRNPDKPRVGPFQANIGGFLSSCLFGLTGLRVGANEPSEWARRPVVLPEGWSAIEVENLWIRGRQASLHAAHGAERAELIVEGD